MQTHEIEEKNGRTEWDRKRQEQEEKKNVKSWIFFPAKHETTTKQSNVNQKLHFHGQYLLRFHV